MPKYRVYVTTSASGYVDIEVPDDVTDPEEISELAFSKHALPELGANASGWGQPWGLELGEWEPDVVDGVSYVTDLNGDQILAGESSDA